MRAAGCGKGDHKALASDFTNTRKSARQRAFHSSLDQTHERLQAYRPPGHRHELIALLFSHYVEQEGGPQ
jgi:hypothetical protein